MFLSKHLTCYNGYYYYQAKVPVDLKHHFSCTFIKKSLRTCILSEAKTLLVAMEYKIHKAFTALRSGMLSDDYIKLVLNEIIPDRSKVVSTGNKITKVIRQYVAEKESGWTYPVSLWGGSI
ncbi:MAG: DUF6538 domain-containing protein [Desulfuromonadaceae bacterium]